MHRLILLHRTLPCYFLFAAMPKVKNGRKCGPPADRRRSSRATRVPRRLVDAASDSSSSDTDDLDTVNQALRQQLQDVQRQLYEAQASSTQPRPPVAQSSTSVPTATASSPLQPAGLATAMPILHLPLAGPSPVTPLPTTQPGTSALDSQGTDLQALLASTLQQMAGTTQLGTAQGESPMTPFLILGATLDPKIKATIWAHQYIDLGSLVPPPTEPTGSGSVFPPSQHPQMSMTQPRATPIQHVR